MSFEENEELTLRLSGKEEQSGRRGFFGKDFTKGTFEIETYSDYQRTLVPVTIENIGVAPLK